MDRWESYPVALGGGVIKNLPPLQQASEAPGSLTRGVNIETSRETSGYRRIEGYKKFDSNEVPGTGDILGSFVYEGSVIACREDKIYKSGGSGWTQINSNNLNPNANKYEGHRYNWGSENIILVDGVNNPLRYDNSTMTRLSPSKVPTCVQEFKFHMFFGAGNSLIYSAPNDETDFSGTNGAGEINVGFGIRALAVWRDQLYIFGRNAISKLVGNNSQDFQLQPVTSRIGIVARDTVQEVAGDVLYLADDGVRTIAGTERIGDVELSSLSEAIYKDIRSLANTYQNGKISSVVVSEKGQYRLFPVLGTENFSNTQGFLGCLIRGTGGNIQYEWFELQGFQALCADSDYINNAEIVVHGGFDGYVYQQEQGNSFGSRDINAYLELPYLNFGAPRVRHTLYKITSYGLVEGESEVNANLIFDFNDNTRPQPSETRIISSTGSFPVLGNFVLGQDVLGADPFIRRVVNVVGSGYTHTVVISSNDQKSPWTIEELIFEYSTNGRR